MIYKELKDFQAGARVNAIMTPFALHLSDQDMIDLASYYAYLPRLPAYHPAAPHALPRIVINGAPLRDIAPCGSCHGALDNKVGSPWLEGQSAVYIKSQLEAFASDERRNDISRADAQHRAADDAGGNRTGGAILRLAALSRRAIGSALTFERLGPMRAAEGFFSRFEHANSQAEIPTFVDPTQAPEELELPLWDRQWPQGKAAAYELRQRVECSLPPQEAFGGQSQDLNHRSFGSGAYPTGKRCSMSSAQ